MASMDLVAVRSSTLSLPRVMAISVSRGMTDTMILFSHIAIKFLSL